MNLRFYTVFISLLLFITSCAPKQDGSLPINDSVTRLSAEEREQKIGNNAFEAVYENEEDRVQTLLDEQRSLFYAFNNEGHTPLMAAMTLRRHEMALLIANSLTLEELEHKDAEGRGYISYAAQFNMIEVLDTIFSKYRDSVLYINFHFGTVDFEDNLGRTALFYASSGAVAQRLKEMWMYSWQSSLAKNTFPWSSGFYRTYDNLGQTFLHTAAENNKADVIRWAAEDLCGPAPAHDWGSSFLGIPWLLGQGWDSWQRAMQADPLNIVTNDLFNMQSDTDDTPLHLAVRHGHEEAAKALMNCRLTAYGYQNVFGRNPLSELIIHMDRHTDEVDPARREIFESLYQRVTGIWKWVQNPKDYVDMEDNDGKTSLHHAARLNDTYFYETLKDIGDIYNQDNQGNTPDGLFRDR